MLTNVLNSVDILHIAVYITVVDPTHYNIAHSVMFTIFGHISAI